MTNTTICDGEFSIRTVSKGQGLAFYAPIAAKYEQTMPPPAALFLYACMMRSHDPYFVDDMLTWLHEQKSTHTN